MGGAYGAMYIFHYMRLHICDARDDKSIPGEFSSCHTFSSTWGNEINLSTVLTLEKNKLRFPLSSHVLTQ